MTELLALAERCERSAGPDRELDILIGYAVDLKGDDKYLSFRASFDVCGMEQMLRMAESHQNIWRTELPRFTGSIDAAITLIPKCWTRVVDASAPEHGIDVDLFPPDDLAPKLDDVKGTSLFEPLATIAAALRARAAEVRG